MRTPAVPVDLICTPSGETVFADRREAGQRLARALQGLKYLDPVVVALPRGGVVIAAEIARGLEAPLEVLPVARIAAPGYPELTLAAFTIDAETVVDPDVGRAAAPLRGYVEWERLRLAPTLISRQVHYRASDLARIAGRHVVLVDDGVASGSSARAALQSLARMKPKHTTLAVPVAPIETLDELAADFDSVVCLAAPVPFGWVGHYYQDFSPVVEAEVLRIVSDHVQDYES